MSSQPGYSVSTSLIHRIFTKQNQLLLSSESVNYIVQHFKQPNNDTDINKKLIIWAQKCKELLDTTTIIQPSDLERVQRQLGTLLSVGDQGEMIISESWGDHVDVSNLFKVIDAYNMTKATYDPLKKQLIKDLKPTSILSGPDARHQMYHDRYYSIYTRLDQNNVPKRLTRQGTHFLNSTKSILGRSTGRFTLFGMLTIINNSIHLQDPDGFIPLSFENCEPTEDLFTDHCMVLVHGQLDPDKLFSVEKIEFPSHEFTKPHTLPPSHPYHPSNQPPFSLSQGQIELIQEQSSDVYMIVISDFFLDQQKTIDDFQTLLTNINQSTSTFPTVPLAFILCGNFISNPINSNTSSVSNYASGFSRLAQCLSKFPKICSWSHFVFIPGPNDFNISPAVPHAPLLNYLVKPLKETLRNTHFTTNPTKILFCKRELNIYRQDLSQQIHRNQLIQLGKGTGDRNHFSQINLLKTISQGGHLSPISINCQPIHPDFDHSLRLDYLPDILILPDSNAPYTIPTDYCLYGNPGSFSNGGDFMVYFPKDNQCDLKNVNSV